MHTYGHTYHRAFRALVCSIKNSFRSDMSFDQDYRPPSWAGVPPPGLHLDVVKNGSVLQKLLLDEKSYYIFGRNRESCDFPLQHQSCSRQHAVLVYHKHLKRPFLIDLGSTHGTFIGSTRLEPNKPTQLPLDTTISFGASTRSYTLRERPQAIVSLISEGEGEGGEVGEGGALLGLPELDNEVDDLTQYNTAHNRQISMVGITDVDKPRKRKSHANSVMFSEEEEIINPEDVDPSIGKFRNMIQTTIIPTKRQKLNSGEATVTTPTSPTGKFTQPLSSPTALYTDVPLPSSLEATSTSTLGGFGAGSLFAKGISAAPPVANPAENMPQLGANRHAPSAAAAWGHIQSSVGIPSLFSDSAEPRKKKYAKEAWPGKKPPQHLLV